VFDVRWLLDVRTFIIELNPKASRPCVNIELSFCS
jgi:hypothetical protein